MKHQLRLLKQMIVGFMFVLWLKQSCQLTFNKIKSANMCEKVENE